MIYFKLATFSEDLLSYADAFFKIYSSHSMKLYHILKDLLAIYILNYNFVPQFMAKTQDILFSVFSTC
jgi:hypothetical protein